MTTAATAITYSSYLTALNSQTAGVKMIPSSLNEEARYERRYGNQRDLPQLVKLDGGRTERSERQWWSCRGVISTRG